MTRVRVLCQVERTGLDTQLCRSLSTPVLALPASHPLLVAVAGAGSSWQRSLVKTTNCSLYWCWSIGQGEICLANGLRSGRDIPPSESLCQQIPRADVYPNAKIWRKDSKAFIQNTPAKSVKRIQPLVTRTVKTVGNSLMWQYFPELPPERQDTFMPKHK